MDQGDPGSEMFTETEKPSLYRTSINVFLRNPRGGLYAGLRYPYFKPDISERGISLSYETNYLLKPGETLELPSTFVGAYRKTGYIYRKELHWAPRILATEQENWTSARCSPCGSLRDYPEGAPAGRLLHLAQLLWATLSSGANGAIKRPMPIANLREGEVDWP